MSGALPLGFVESAQYPQNTLKRLSVLIEGQQEKIAKLESEVPALQGIIDRNWNKADELAKLKLDCKELQRKIDESLKKAEQTQTALSGHENIEQAA